MRIVCVSLLLVGIAHADTAPRPPWVNACVGTMKQAAAPLGDDFAKGEVRALAEDPPLYCDRRSWVIDYETIVRGAHFAASAGTTDVAGGETQWHLATPPGQRARAWMRRGPGTLGRIATDQVRGPEVDRFEKAFRTAVDSCLQQAPTRSPPVDDPAWTPRCQAQPAGGSSAWVKVCVSAERAARELESMCTWEDELVGATGRRGRGWTELQAVLALGPDSMPIVQRLATSKNPVARIAAARALGLRHSEAGRGLLQRLAGDEERAPARIQERTQLRAVAEFAQESLKSYR